MTVNRRRILQSLAAATFTGASAEAAEPTVSIDALRSVSIAHETNLSDDRLRILQPVLDHRAAQIRTLRNFDLEESVAPTQGINDRY